MKKLDEKQKAWLYSAILLLIITALLIVGTSWLFYEIGKPKEQPLALPEPDTADISPNPARRFMTVAEKRARILARIPLASTPWDKAGPPGHSQNQPFSADFSASTSRLRFASLPWHKQPANAAPLYVAHANIPWSKPLQPLRTYDPPLSAANPWSLNPATALPATLPTITIVWSAGPHPLNTSVATANLPWPESTTVRPATLSLAATLPWPSSLSFRPTSINLPASLPWSEDTPRAAHLTITAQVPWSSEPRLQPVLLSTIPTPWSINLQPLPQLSPTAQLPWTPTCVTASSIYRHALPAQLPWVPIAANFPVDTTRHLHVATLPFTDIDTPLSPAVTKTKKQKIP